MKMFKNFLTSCIASFLIITLIFPLNLTLASPITVLNLPAPGSMVAPSDKFNPVIVKGITVYPNDPFKFDFIIDSGNSQLSNQAFDLEATKLIKYFLASLTTPEKDMWVNLSPYEKDRIVPENFGVTEMGRDLLAQDYILKQLTSSLIYPEKQLGKEFWAKVYAKAQKLYGTTEIPVSTFNKVWIVPSKAVVWEHGQSAYVAESHLKVMLEQDYLSLAKHTIASPSSGVIASEAKQSFSNGVTSQVVREVLLPVIEKEVNEGKNFAALRQVYNSVILATWYKKNLQSSILGQVYINKNKDAGVDVADKQIKQEIYQQYLQAFKKGVFNYIKEESFFAQAIRVGSPPLDGEGKGGVIIRKYFSGGTEMVVSPILDVSRAMVAPRGVYVGVQRAHLVTAELANAAMAAPGTNLITGGGLTIVAQHVTATEGAKTGDVYIGSAISKGANGIIAGHSEVRSRDSDADINRQVRAAFNAKLRDIILCVGETEEEKFSGKSQEVIKRQVLAALSGFTYVQVAQMIIAYEPRWAIAGSGKGQAASAQDAQEMARVIREIIHQRFSVDAASGVRILYGGSVDANSAREFLFQDDVDGLLVSGKSVAVDEFKPIIALAQDIGPKHKHGRIPYIGGNFQTYLSKTRLPDTRFYLQAIGRFDPLRVQVGIAPQAARIRDFSHALKALANPAMAVRIPFGFGKVLRDKHGLKLRSISLGLVKGEGEIDPEVLANTPSQYVLATSSAAALGSFNLRGRGRETANKQDIKKAGDGNAVQMVEDETRALITDNHYIAFVELASEGKRDGSFSSPVGRIYHVSLGGDNHYIDTVTFTAKGKIESFDIDLYKRTIDSLRAQGVKIFYNVTDALEKTEGLIDPKALNNPTDSWALVGLLGDLKSGYRLPIDDDFREAGVSYNAPRAAEGIGPMDKPSQIIPRILEAKGYTPGTPAFAEAMSRVVFFALGPRDVYLDKDSGNQRHMHFINDALAMPGIQVRTDSDGDLMPRLLAQLGESSLVEDKIIVVEDRSGSAEARAARGFNPKGAHLLARFVSTSATKDAVVAEKADEYTPEEMAVATKLGYTSEDMKRATDAADEQTENYIAMTAVTGASERFGKTFADAMPRVAYNDSEGTVKTNTLFSAEGKVYLAQITYESSDIVASRRSINNNSPGSKAVAEELGLDAAMGVNPKVEGGINLDTAIWDLQVRHDGKGIILPASQQPMQRFKNIKGLTPRIIKDVEINLPQSLGVGAN